MTSENKSKVEKRGRPKRINPFVLNSPKKKDPRIKLDGYHNSESITTLIREDKTLQDRYVVLPQMSMDVKLRQFDMDLMTVISNIRDLAKVLGTQHQDIYKWRRDPIRGPAFRDVLIELMERIGRREFNTFTQMQEWLIQSVERRVKYRNRKLLQDFYVIALHARFMQLKRAAIDQRQRIVEGVGIQLDFFEDFNELKCRESTSQVDSFLKLPGGVGDADD